MMMGCEIRAYKYYDLAEGKVHENRECGGTEIFRRGWSVSGDDAHLKELFGD